MDQSCRLSIIFYEQDGTYEFSNHLRLTEGCPVPKEGIENWADNLAGLIIAQNEINLDSINSSLIIQFNSTGQIADVGPFDNSKAMDRSDSIIAISAMDMGNWNQTSNDRTLELQIWNRQNEVFVIVEESAKFPGGSEALYAYLQQNLSYPEKALSSGVEGRVFVQFIIERDGSLSNIEILKGIGSGCDEEVIRLIESMPKWKPGKNRGEAVRQKYIQPINFEISKKKKRKSKKKKY